MPGGESSIDQRKPLASERRMDEAHPYGNLKSKEAKNEKVEADRGDASLQVVPFPFSHVSPHQRKQIEIHVGETMITESRLNQLRRGDVVNLDSSIDEEVVIWCDGRRLASGKLVVANGRLAVLLSEKPNVGDDMA